MNCPKCQFPLSEDMAFCPECGEKASDTQRVVIPEKSREDTLGATTVIPVVGRQRGAEPKAEPEPVKEQKPAKDKPSEKSGAEKAVSGRNDTKTKILTILVACVITIAVGLGITFAAILVGSMDRSDAPKTVQTDDTKNKKDEKEEKTDTAGLEIGESVGVEEKTGIKIDKNYPFATGQKLTATERKYKSLRNSEFGYKCDIPSDFVFLSDADGEIRYGAGDKTAYMDIGAFANRNASAAGDVKATISHELGTSADYEVSGDDWFIMRSVKSGVVYYHKCFATESSVRYIEFVYPAEYSEIYDAYVDDIGSSFEKTN